ncbi:unsaturated chondroitin disaccharide hydrolase [Marmoricola sp. URHA0025 HA25]
MTIETGQPPVAERAFATAAAKLRRLVEQHPGKVPVYTVNGKWHLDSDAWAPMWTAGFLAGQLWLLAEHTGEAWWRRHAEQYSRDLAERRFDAGTHDIGFLFTPSWGRWRRFEDTEEVRAVLVDAGRTMARRFNERGNYLSSWVDPGSTFIDVMMNIDIIWEAATIADDPALAKIATAHALTSRRYLVRGDGTTVHEAWFDPETGEFLRAATHQGWRADSSWVRGQTWGIYGFAAAYARTEDTRFLDTSRQLAATYIARTPELVPPNDWDEPAPAHRVEASAASVAAAGLAYLASVSGDESYADRGRQIIRRLSEPDYLSSEAEEWDGLIQQATYHQRNNLGVNESVMWGDYYYLEAVHRLYGKGTWC